MGENKFDYPNTGIKFSPTPQNTENKNTTRLQRGLFGITKKRGGRFAHPHVQLHS